MSEKLKPCPFCGCKDIMISEKPFKMFRVQAYYCYCVSCEVESSLSQYKNRTIEWWNTRQDPMDKLVEFMTEEHDNLTNLILTSKHDAYSLERQRQLSAIFIKKAKELKGDEG